MQEIKNFKTSCGREMSKAGDYAIEQKLREVDADLRHHLGHCLRNHLQHIQGFVESGQPEQAMKHIEYMAMELKRLGL